MARVREFEIDDSFMAEVANAVADGADSTRKVAAAVGINYSTFRNWRYRKNSTRNIELSAQLEIAIKKGATRRRHNLRAIAEDAIAKSIAGFYVEEETTEIKRDEKTGKQIVQKKKTRKFVNPNVTAQIFTLCNVAPEKWVSIHKMDAKQDTDGAIVKWLNAQATEGRL